MARIRVAAVLLLLNCCLSCTHSQKHGPRKGTGVDVGRERRSRADEGNVPRFNAHGLTLPNAHREVQQSPPSHWYSFQKVYDIPHPPWDEEWKKIILRNRHWPCQQALDVMTQLARNSGGLQFNETRLKIFGKPRKIDRLAASTPSGPLQPGGRKKQHPGPQQLGSSNNGITDQERSVSNRTDPERAGPPSRSALPFGFLTRWMRAQPAHHSNRLAAAVDASAGTSMAGNHRPPSTYAHIDGSTLTHGRGNTSRIFKPVKEYYADGRPRKSYYFPRQNSGPDKEESAAKNIAIAGERTRRRREASEQYEPDPNCMSTQLDFHFINGFASESTASLTLAGQQYNVRYANALHSVIKVEATDTYSISHASGETEFPLSSADYGLPCNGEMYMCTGRDRNHPQNLHLEVALFYPPFVNELKQAGNASIFVYNSLEMLGLPANVDMLLFSSRQAALQMPALFRIAANLDLNDDAEAVLPVGRYTMKVVRHNTTVTHCNFLKSKSLLPEMTVVLRAGLHYFMTLHGRVNIAAYAIGRGSDSSVEVHPFPGTLTAYPPAVTEKIWNHARVYMVNAFRSATPVHMKLLRKNFRASLHYGNITCFENVSVEEGDCYILRNRGNDAKLWDLIYDEVPSKNAECFIVADHKSGADGLDIFFQCFDSTDILPGPGYAEIVVYHALDGIDAATVDILLKKMDESDGQDSVAPIYAVASKLALGHGQTRLIEAGLYEMKVVASNSVYTIEDFDVAVSLVVQSTVYLRSQGTYYGTIQGLANNSAESEESYPPFLNLFPIHQKPQVKPQDTSQPMLAPSCACNERGLTFPLILAMSASLMLAGPVSPLCLLEFLN